jgi:hypothetical protein
MGTAALKGVVKKKLIVKSTKTIARERWMDIEANFTRDR